MTTIRIQKYKVIYIMYIRATDKDRKPKEGQEDFTLDVYQYEKRQQGFSKVGILIWLRHRVWIDNQ